MIEGTITKLKQLREDTEGESPDSRNLSSSDSSSSWDVDLDGGEVVDEDAKVEDVNQVEDPTLVPAIALLV